MYSFIKVHSLVQIHIYQISHRQVGTDLTALDEALPELGHLPDLLADETQQQVHDEALELGVHGEGLDDGPKEQGG